MILIIDIDEITLKKFFVEYGDILFQRSSETFEDIGRANVYLDKEHPATFGGFVIRGKKISDYNPLFFRYLLCTHNARKQTVRMGAGAQHYNIGQDGLEKISLYFPSLPEQDKIAHFIGCLDERIAAQNKIIEDLKILKKELMDYILNSCDFVELTIQELINTGYARIIKASELKKFDGTREYLSTSSIGGNGIEQIESIITYTHRPSRAAMFPIKGSIWFAKMKNTVKVYQSSADDENRYILSTGFYGLLCNENKVNPYWLLELFKSDYFNTQKDRFSEGSSMSGIKDKQLMDIKLKVFTNRNKEAFHTSNIQALSQKITLEKTILKKLLKQKQFYLNALFI